MKDFEDRCKKADYDIHEEGYISVSIHTTDNEIIKEARKRGYVIQYKIT